MEAKMGHSEVALETVLGDPCTNLGDAMYHFRGPMYHFRGPMYRFRGPLYHFRGPLYHFRGPLYRFRGRKQKANLVPRVFPPSERKDFEKHVESVCSAQTSKIL